MSVERLGVAHLGVDPAVDLPQPAIDRAVGVDVSGVGSPLALAHSTATAVPKSAK